MITGSMQFICSECGNKFMGIGTEYMASVLVTPLKCANCGSMHTRPNKITDAIPGMRKINDNRYKTIWESIDKQNDGI